MGDMTAPMEIALAADGEAARSHVGNPSLQRLLALPRGGLGDFPTPITEASDQQGRRVLIKRDDLSGLGRGGAKARKIDLLLGHLLTHGHDELITLVGNVTNLAFDLLPVLDRAGIRATLLVLDDPPLTGEERKRIFAGVLHRIQLLPASRARAAWVAGRALARARLAGRNPFVLLPGASHPVAVFGNALGFVEMVLQREQQHLPLPSTVWVTAATGTTIAGFALAEELLRRSGRPPIRIVGVEAYDRGTRLRTRALKRWSMRRLGDRRPAVAPGYTLDDAALQGGFASFDATLSDLCHRVRREVGIAIDPIFGGKTWSRLEARATVEDERPALYWHCGYTPEWEELKQGGLG